MTEEYDLHVSVEELPQHVGEEIYYPHPYIEGCVMMVRCVENSSRGLLHSFHSFGGEGREEFLLDREG